MRIARCASALVVALLSVVPVLTQSETILGSAQPMVVPEAPGYGGVKISQLPPVSARDAFVPDRVLVKFRPFRNPAAASQPIFSKRRPHPASQGRRMAAGLTPDQQIALASIQGRVIMGFERSGWLVVNIGVSVGEAIEKLYGSGQVAFAEPDYIVSATDIPDDPSFDQQWGLNNTGQDIGSSGGGTDDADIDAPEAWDTKDHARSVLIGVIDTGVDYEHEDLADNMWRNPNEEPDNGIDDDDNGYVDDIFGVNTISGASSTDPMDDHFHGTHVAGTAGASTNNGIGVAGVARETQIVALKFLAASGSGSTGDAIAAIEYMLNIAEANGYERVVLNNSWGGGGFSQALEDTIVATRDAGFLFVAAAGNDALNADMSPHYPSSHNVENVVSVGSTDFNDAVSSFSNYGCHAVDVFAPGSNILSTFPGNEYNAISGTSMASPHVAGLAALVWSLFSGDDWSRIKNATLNSVEQIAALKGLAVSQGRVNLATALKPAGRTMPTVYGVSPAFVSPGGEVRITGTRFGDAEGLVRFTSTDLEIVSWSDTEIVARIPSDVDLTIGPVRVTSAADRYGRTGGCLRVGYGATLVGKTIVPHGRHASVQSGRKLWLMGGIGFDGVPTQLVERYDIVTGDSTIESKWYMPHATFNGTGAMAAGRIHVLGGMNERFRYTDAHQVFNLSNGTWSEARPLPEALILPGVGSAGGKLYFFGGLEAGQALPTDAAWVFDRDADEWTALAPLPNPVAGAAVIKLPSGRLRVIGGFSTDLFGSGTSFVQEYVPSTDEWLQRTELNMTREGAAAGLINGEMAVLHGAGRTDGELFRQGRWRPAFAGLMPLFLPGLAIRQSDLFIVGGSEMHARNGFLIFFGYRQQVFRTTVN